MRGKNRMCSHPRTGDAIAEKIAETNRENFNELNFLRQNHGICRLVWPPSRADDATIFKTKSHHHCKEKIAHVAAALQVARAKYRKLSGILAKSGPLDFATKNSFPLFFVFEKGLVHMYQNSLFFLCYKPKTNFACTGVSGDDRKAEIYGF